MARTLDELIAEHTKRWGSPPTWWYTGKRSDRDLYNDLTVALDTDTEIVLPLEPGAVY